MTQLLIIILCAFALDRLMPDRYGFKPFAWYPDWAESIEQRFNGGKRSHGVGAVLLAVVPIVIGVMFARFILGEIASVLRFIFDVVILYVCINIYRLGKTADAVSNALEAGNTQEADEQLRELSGKGATELSETGIARAAVEAVLKQGSSLVVSPIFWFILLGPVGAVLQRLASILDTLWGHRYDRFTTFGWAAARLDDLMQWIPARITALSYAIMGSFEDALYCWRQRVGAWSDLNSGPVLASGFGAMHMPFNEPGTGDDETAVVTSNFAVVPDAGHVRGVVALVWRVLVFWLVIGVLMAAAHLAGFISG